MRPIRKDERQGNNQEQPARARITDEKDKGSSDRPRRLYTINCLSKTFNLIWKGFIMAFGVIGIFMGFISDVGYMYFIYFTNVTYMVFVLYSILNFIHEIVEPPRDSHLTKMVSITHGLAFPSELFLCIFYWVMLGSDDFENMENRCWSVALCQMLTISYHGIVMVLAWIPIFTEHLVTPWSYLVFVYIYGFGYAIFVLLPASLLRDREVYRRITFRNVYSYVIITLGMLSVGAFYALGKWLNHMIIGELGEAAGKEKRPGMEPPENGDTPQVHTENRKLEMSN